MPSSFWPSEAVLYGGPYPALVASPESSAAAVATTSLGAALAQSRIVSAFSSGEPNTAASTIVRTATPASARTNSLTRSQRRVGKACESAVVRPLCRPFTA